MHQLEWINCSGDRENKGKHILELIPTIHNGSLHGAFYSPLTETGCLLVRHSCWCNFDCILTDILTLDECYLFLVDILATITTWVYTQKVFLQQIWISNTWIVTQGNFCDVLSFCIHVSALCLCINFHRIAESNICTDLAGSISLKPNDYFHRPSETIGTTKAKLYRDNKRDLYFVMYVRALHIYWLCT